VSAAISAVRRPATLPTEFILLTMSLGVLIAQIDTSIVNLALTQIGAEFGTEVDPQPHFVRHLDNCGGSVFALASKP